MSQVSQAIEEQYVQNILENNDIQEETTDIKEALKGDDSIDCFAEDLEHISAPVIRDYLGRYNTKRKEEEWKLYTKEDISKYTTIKSVLAHRA